MVMLSLAMSTTGGLEFRGPTQVLERGYISGFGWRDEDLQRDLGTRVEVILHTECLKVLRGWRV